jgi:hypothetical protein
MATSDLASAAQRYSDACIKVTVGALVLSAIAVGLAERFVQVREFEALGKYEIAREELYVLRGTLDKDACWQRYRSSLKDPSEADLTPVLVPSGARVRG